MGPQCSVIYCNDPGKAPDLAILKIDDLQRSSTHDIPIPVIPSHHYNIGETVAIISYGLLRPYDDNTPPLVTKGAISRVIQHNNTPVMIQVSLNGIHLCIYNMSCIFINCCVLDNSSGWCW